MTFKRWLPTFLAFPVGGFVTMQIVGGASSPAKAAAAGLITGAAVGGAQSLLLARGRAVWTAITATGWSSGWLVTSLVIVDIERHHAVFGSSGALLVTVLTGLALRRAVLA